MQSLAHKYRSLFLGVITFGAMGVVCEPARAENVPNLVGTWKGTAQAIHVGVNPYRSPTSSAPAFSSSTMEFVITIEQQKDNRIIGKKTSGERSETLFGSISPNNLNGVMLDEDGQYLFTIRDPNTLDVCYNHLNPTSKVVACYTWKRSQ